jgi:hypothetical protein
MVFIGLREQDEDMSRIKADRDSAVKVKKTRRDPSYPKNVRVKRWWNGKKIAFGA